MIDLDRGCGSFPALAGLCHAAALSRSSLCRAFKVESGTSPGAYVRTMRLRRAVELLALSRLSVKEIAFAVGFRSESGFIYSFRRTFGLPPRQYRKELSKS
jgi:AraC family transcriptional activator of mtrCDE